MKKPRVIEGVLAPEPRGGGNGGGGGGGWAPGWEQGVRPEVKRAAGVVGSSSF